MSKYDFDFKKKVVSAYLNGEGGEGLLRSRKNKDYSFEYKCSIVELYLTSELSVRDIAEYMENCVTRDMLLTKRGFNE